jgi:curved DNA-binding protein CbpA
MKLDSKYFDSIRASRGRAGEAPRTKGPVCQWRGCDLKGAHRAPKGRGRENEFYFFCDEHVRQYNASYNYFDGMSDAEVQNFQRDSATGHRPTWTVGANSWAHGTRSSISPGEAQRATQANSAKVRGFQAWRAKKSGDGDGDGDGEAASQRRRLKPLERKAMATLELPETATKEQVKTRFKELVKRYHPDLNGGDRSLEDRLRETIQAYNFLKQASLV